ncbi:MAG: hypothetical protein CVU11_05370 [Bacteroidetes bacterium HGW-Bacteroidetes-6]|jgi:hypothetical protein|nr:MAG: hypothetical protein CVU11_05370 [Bacteroidetes bacterium HGW-Bacteroidetes-6]
MKKTILLMATILLISMSAFSQKGFMHSAGYGFYYGVGKISTDDTTGMSLIYRPTLSFNSGVYYPRINLSDSRDNNFSIGAPIALGFSGSFSSSSGSSFSFGLDLPVMFDYSFGHGSAERNKDGFGGFIGAGFGYTLSSYSYESWYGNVSETASTAGPAFHAGIRFPLSIKGNDMSYTIRFMYKLGLDENRFKVFGFSILVNL